MGWPKLVRGAKTPVRVVITSEDPNEYGERPIILDKSFLCNYQDSATVKYSADKQAPTVTGKLFIDGDILKVEDGVLNYVDGVEAKSEVVISGYVVIFGRRCKIVIGRKARNLDGSVNYTQIEVS